MSKKILLVDDQSFIRTLISSKLQPVLNDEIVLLEADNGDDAIELGAEKFINKADMQEINFPAIVKEYLQ